MALHVSLIASLPCVPRHHASLVIMRPLLSCVPCYHASLVIMRPLLSCVPCYHASLVIMRPLLSKPWTSTALTRKPEIRSGARTGPLHRLIALAGDRQSKPRHYAPNP